MSNSKPTPWVTLALVVANISLAYWLRWHPDLVELWGFRPDHPRFISALLSTSLHLNTLHLLGNMLALAATGSWVEEATGWWRYLMLYVLGGLAGCAAHWMAFHKALLPEPLIGASGAVACFVAYGSVRFMWSKVYLLPKVRVPLIAMSGVWALLQVLGAFVKASDAGGVSFWAHVGGFAMGLLMAAVFGAPKQASLHRGHKTLNEMADRSPAAEAAAAKAVLKQHPDDIEAWQRLAVAQGQCNETKASIEAWTKVLEIGDSARKDVAVVSLSALGGLATLPSLQRAKLAEILSIYDKSPELLLESIANGADHDPQRPEAMFALGRRLQERGSNDARTWFEKLKEQYPMHPATDIARTRGWIS